jgi:hypothetical protein
VGQERLGRVMAKPRNEVRVHRLRQGSRGKTPENLVVGTTMRGSQARPILAAPPGLARPPKDSEPLGGFPVQYVPQLPQPSRMLVVPLLAAALGAGVATATFAIVNMEDQASVSLPRVQSAPPSDALAGERSDGGPNEGSSADVLTHTQPPKAVAANSERGATADPRRARAQAHSLSPEPSHAHDGLLQRRRR